MYQRLKNSLFMPKEIARYAYDKFYVIVLYMLIFVALLSIPGIIDLKNLGQEITYEVSNGVTIDKDVQYYIKDKQLVDISPDKSSPTYYFQYDMYSSFSGVVLVIGQNIDASKLNLVPFIIHCANDGIYLGFPYTAAVDEKTILKQLCLCIAFNKLIVPTTLF